MDDAIIGYFGMELDGYPFGSIEKDIEIVRRNMDIFSEHRIYALKENVETGKHYVVVKETKRGNY